MSSPEVLSLLEAEISMWMVIDMKETLRQSPGPETCSDLDWTCYLLTRNKAQFPTNLLLVPQLWFVSVLLVTLQLYFIADLSQISSPADNFLGNLEIILLHLPFS